MLARVWRSRLTWRASIVLLAAACLTLLVAAGINGTPGTILILALVAGWFLLLGKMSDNEARHVLRLAEAKGTRAPERRVRRLLFPWWARATLILGVLAATLAAIPRLGDGLSALTFVLGIGAVLAVERVVIAVRSPRD